MRGEVVMVPVLGWKALSLDGAPRGFWCGSTTAMSGTWTVSDHELGHATCLVAQKSACLLWSKQES